MKRFVKRVVSSDVVRSSGVPAAILLVILLLAPASFARSKNRSAIHSDLAQLEEALKAGDLSTAQSVATAIYQQDTAVAAVQAPAPDIIIDPALATESAEHLREKAACQIAECFYKHAELEIAKQWAQTAAANGTLANQFVRRATVLLGDIAMAMDRDDEAVTNYTAIINLKNQFREQPAAYAHLLELLMLRKQDDLVEQWVRHGQNKFEGAGGLELDFLRETAKTLKRRNHPLWNELDQQIVDLTPEGKRGRLPALRELASNARKFGRYVEAETNYAAICAMPLKSAEETVNAHLMLAEVQAKQNKDITPTLQLLQSKAAAFTNSVDREYATYRLAKFYEEQGNLASAGATYQSLASSASTSTWAAASLHQLAALREKQGDLQTALQLYRQYPTRFAQNDRLAIQSLASALNVAQTLGDTNAAEQIASAITAKAATVQDYNVHLNLAFYYKKRGREQQGRAFLETGLKLAQQQASRTTDADARTLIHFRVLRRLVDFGDWQRLLDNYSQVSGHLQSSSIARRNERWNCEFFRAFALSASGRRSEATDLCRTVFDAIQSDGELSAQFAVTLGQLIWDKDTSAATRPVLEWAAENYPNSPWSNYGRVILGIQFYNEGQVEKALKAVEAVIAATPTDSKMEWIRCTYWQAVYLRGRALVSSGQQLLGQQVMAEALQNYQPMPIVALLRN
jgi:tetratricopeptide (TPR) repeat protein